MLLVWVLASLWPSEANAKFLQWNRLPKSKDEMFYPLENMEKPMSVFECGALVMARFIPPGDVSGLQPHEDGNAFEYDRVSKNCTIGKVRPFDVGIKEMIDQAESESPSKNVFVNLGCMVNGKDWLKSSTSCPI